MVKKSEGKVTEVQAEETVETPPQDEVTPPTTEEQLATLQGELDTLKAKYEQADKGLRSAQATLTQKDRLIKEKEDIRGEIDSMKDMIKILATSYAQGSQVSDDDLENVTPQKKQDINKAYEELEQKNRLRKQQEDMSQKIAEFGKRVESLGLTEEDDAYWEINELVTDVTPYNYQARFKRADIKLKKMEKEKAPVDKEPTDEGKEDKISELEKEIARLKKIQSGELDAETGAPSGASKNREEIMRRLASGDTTYEEAEKSGVKFS